MTEQELGKIISEKSRLIDLIRPAISQFVEITGMIPEIIVSVNIEKTQCGTVKSVGVIDVKIWL